MTPPPLLESSAFRDLGGLASREGHRVRAGRLYRSDALSSGESADRERLSALGLRLVCDLRSAAERRARPCFDGLVPAPRTMHLELAPVLEAGTSACMARLRRAPSAETAGALMRRTYELLPQACAPRLAELFAALRRGDVPALIHCTAGKDRTGFVVAMVLSAIGVPHDAIFSDYLRASRPEHGARSRARTAHLMELALGQPLEESALAIMSTVQPDFLDASFAAIARDYGSVDAYLRIVAQLDAAAREELSSVFIERDPDG
jgi:protein-tyrosine phosphatase